MSSTTTFAAATAATSTILPSVPKMTPSQVVSSLWEQGYQGNQAMFERARQVREGEIHHFKSLDRLNALDRRCLSVPEANLRKASSHPVIILHCPPASTHAVVTTISAYASGDFNNNLAPWKQRKHQCKRSSEFRAFVGSERPNDRRALLELEGGLKMPKEKVSWVYAMDAFVVPITAIGRYNKVDTTLRLTEKSFLDLKSHMMALERKGTLPRALEDVRLQYTISSGVISRKEVRLEVKTIQVRAQAPPAAAPLGPKGWKPQTTVPNVAAAHQGRPLKRSSWRAEPKTVPKTTEVAPAAVRRRTHL